MNISIVIKMDNLLGKKTSMDALLHNPIILSVINYKDLYDQEFPAQPVL